MSTAVAQGRSGPPDGGRPVGAGQATDYEALYQDAPCGYLTTGDDSSIVTANDTFLRWTGHRREDIVGTPLTGLMPVGDRLLYSTRCMPQLLISGAVPETLVEIVCADGTRRPALLSAARSVAAGGSGGAPVRVIVFSAHERRAYEQELVASLRRAEESEAQRARAEGELQRLAHLDPLTGLANRAGIVAALRAALGTDDPDAGSGDGPHVAVLSVDLDVLKAVNDSLGHAAGDELLMVAADRLRAVGRDSGAVARVYGDEFVIVDRIDQPDSAGVLAGRVVAALNAPMTIDGLEVVTSVSVGVVAASGPQGDPDGLLRRADAAMYRAKARGRGCWEAHDASRTDSTVNRLRLLGDLRRAIVGDELRLHYQPRVNLRTGRPAGVEALVRWEHPERGLLPPSEFIDVAEESGLIGGLGAWVLREAVDQAARWRALPGGSAGEMAINVSARQLADPALVGLVADALASSGLPAGDVTLEITETALMHDPDAALTALTALKGLGVRLAIDDFGTGYASLTYLHTFPVDELKIDRSFVSGTAGDRGNPAIVAACVQLAHGVGIQALAEGVETEQQREALTELGCDLAQGNFYCRPLPPDAAAAWLAANTPQS